jgi:DNA-binding transcriptional regulator GbsR (MarR family)
MLALNSAHPRWMEHWELMQITGRSRGAVCWGVRYLAENGLVRSIKSARHPQYLRYQAVITVTKAE